jgi:hypothetical protein
MSLVIASALAGLRKHVGQLAEFVADSEPRSLDLSPMSGRVSPVGRSFSASAAVVGKCDVPEIRLSGCQNRDTSASR